MIFGNTSQNHSQSLAGGLSQHSIHLGGLRSTLPVSPSNYQGPLPGTSTYSSAPADYELHRLRELFEERITRCVVDVTAPLQNLLSPSHPVVAQLVSDPASAVFLQDHVAEVVQRELRSQLEQHNQHLMRALSVALDRPSPALSRRAQAFLSEATHGSSSVLGRLPGLIEVAYDLCEAVLGDDDGNTRRSRDRTLQEISELHQNFRYMRRLAKDKDRETQDLSRQLSEGGTQNEELARDRDIMIASLQYVAQTCGLSSSLQYDMNNPRDLGKACLTAMTKYQNRRMQTRKSINTVVEKTLSCVRSLRGPLQEVRGEVLSMHHAMSTALGQVSRVVQNATHQRASMQRSVEGILAIFGTLFEVPNRAELMESTAEFPPMESLAAAAEAFRSKTGCLRDDIERLRHDMQTERAVYERELGEWERINRKTEEARGALEAENATLTARVDALSRRLAESEKLITSLHERLTFKEAEHTTLLKNMVQRPRTAGGSSPLRKS